MITYNLYSIGHGNNDIDSFISSLKKHKIDFLVDVRSVPYSSHLPEYNKEELDGKLRKAEINYLYFGDKLGGRPEGGISKFIGSDAFKQNIDELLLLVKDKNAAMMCSEFDYLRCHRKFINEALRVNGIPIKNIGKDGNIVENEQFSINQY